jgi:Leucine-rich repeat (LRR) protein
MELLKHIIAKCGGIPRIIATIAEELAENLQELETSEATYLLKGVNDDFMGMVETYTEFLSLGGLFSWMQSYFDACPDSLKPCIFYLSVFPMGHNIKRRRLLRRWIAEGYSRDTSSSTSEENGEKLLCELINLSIIHHEESKVHCQVNGFFHEYIISRPMEDNLVFALEGNCSLNSECAGKHLTISSSWDRDIIVFTSMDLSRLRSLTVFGEWRSFFISADMGLLRVLDLTDTSNATNDDLEQIGKVLPRLKFLSVRGCKGISILPESLCGLNQLQTLDVRHTSIVMVSPAIIKLKKLQYVRAGTTILSEVYDDAAMTCVPLSDSDQPSTPLQDSDGTAATLPAQIVDIPTSAPSATLPAQTFDVQTPAQSASYMPRSSISSLLSKLCRTRKHYNGGVKVPSGIGELTALHTLGVVDVNVAGGKAILKELRKLTQLRKLGVSGINRGNSQELCSAISGHAHLESLSVRLDKDKDGLFFDLDNITQPPKTLKSLKLYGDAKILPSWLMHHANLKKGNLEMNVVTQEDLDDIETLRCGDVFHRLCVNPTQDASLRVGKLEAGDTRPGWCEKEFRVKVLEINCTSKLEINFGMWVHFFVERLVLCSTGSSLRVFGLSYLFGLKEVLLKGSYSDELKQDLQRQIDMFTEDKPVLKVQEPRSS